MNQIDVDIKSYPNLFDKKRNLIIPEYQRPYVWGKEKSQELLKDFEEYFLDNSPDKPYYLGTILYYYNKKEGHYEVIDGQQRITTLLIIQKLLSKKPLPPHLDVMYNSHISIKYIKEAQTFFNQNIELLEKLNSHNFLEQLNFTLIVTHSEDDAFTFFDTQNNRGIKLGATDFLKAYHLRAVSSEKLQEESARKWEKSSTKINEGPFLSHLFEKILWRARNWKGQNQIFFENKDAILHTFQKATLKTEQLDSYPLYPNFFNQHSVGHQYHPNGDFFQLQSTLKSNENADYPFSLRQPIHKGLNFFKYTDKYISIYDILFQSVDNIDSELMKVSAFYKSVYNQDMSVYLRHFMQLCLVAYYDVFGNKKILQAAYAFDYLIGSMRLSKQQIKKEAASKCLKESPNNILDIISNAYRPEELFDFIYSISENDEIYEDEKIIINDGVMGRYKGRILGYFNKTEKNLTNRKIWGRI